MLPKILFGLTALAFGTNLSGCASPDQTPVAFNFDESKVVHAVSGEPEDARWTVKVKQIKQHAKFQQDDELCWAACVQTIQSINSQPLVSQSQMETAFINRFPGEDRQAAARSEIMLALAPEYESRFNYRWVVDPGEIPMSEERIIRSICEGQPVIVGLVDEETGMGHACILYALEYEDATASGTAESKYGNGLLDGIERVGDSVATGVQSFLPGEKRDPTVGRDYRIVEAGFFDPWEPAEQRAFKLSREEFLAQKGFAYSQPYAAEVFEERLQWVDKYDEGPGFYVRNILRDATGLIMEDKPLVVYSIDVNAINQKK